MQEPFEVIEVSTPEVKCEGGGRPSGHPRVFLHVDSETGKVVCPYCSRMYVYHHHRHVA